MGGDLDDLKSKISKARQDSHIEEPSVSGPSAEVNTGMRAASEFFGALFAGILCGYLLDRYLGVAPLGIILLPMLGLGLGAYRANNTLNNKNK